MLLDYVEGCPVATCEVGLGEQFTRIKVRGSRGISRERCPLYYISISNGEATIDVRRSARVEVTINDIGHPTIVQF